ncbi:hypothetical protein FNF27_04350 [Cafeteria roenbergensis]|uniref:GST C-terminal domain-containing protein n=1 Tax=Cafeteria roenbergensis TaxID=33653 RepID=A0A5A8E9E0_CAFRO|nr:hypothetical protein FNF29_05881 [Cafeteria roenbergensis]KAA0157827.1 hypothetical protein FNF31_05725 [Cafeteria roenbergensis]KAA0164791.1 hypothetical protein FNF28_03678 [Cafeteria roenbergensis]KAA0174129.1 hypothetical protein FNF27_04350 [Cafeteria roenbergensis]|eukprot:KAA0149495.1 hypothetical protein FNF29_05881 [Cafeteria roenbergensis]
MYTLSGSPDAVLPALAVADFGGVAINFSGVTTGDAVLIGPEGTISGASAVARFLSRCSGTSAAGRGGFEAAKFDSWVSFAFERLMSAPVAAVLDKSRAMLAALVNNGIRYSPSQDKLRADLGRVEAFTAAMAELDAHLTASTFLQGESISASDVVVAAAAYDIFTLVVTQGGASAATPAARRWFETVLATSPLAAAADRARLRRGGAPREGGQIDVRPRAAEISAMADLSVALNAGQRKKASQRDAEKDKKEAAAAAAGTAPAAAAASSADASAPVAVAAVAATASQPSSNTAEPIGRDASIAKALAAIEAAGLPAASYALHTHTPAMNMEDLRAVSGHAGALCKNLFLKAKKARAGDPTDSRMWLLLARDETKTDLKAIGAALGYGKVQVRFGADKDLLENLGARKGEVSPLAAVNDTALRVRIAFDETLAGETAPLVLHPLTNEASIAMPLADLRAYLAHTGHEVVDIKCTA